MTNADRIVVVGGGVAGLATAWILTEQARQRGRALSLEVLEARPDPGGSTRTDRIDGYLCEWGPNGFLDNEPATLELVERLGLRSRLVRASEAAQRRYIFHTGQLHEVPLAPPAFLRSDVVPWQTKLRMALELVVPARRLGGDETVYEFGRRRLGSGFATTLLDPMVSGIFAGNIHELSLPAVFPQMAAMERQHGGLFRALFAKRWQARRTGAAVGGPAGPRGTLHTFRDGMGELTGTLGRELGAIVRTGIAVQAVERGPQGLRVRAGGQSIDARAVVLACPSFAAADIVADLSPEVAGALGRIEHAPVDVVCLGFAEQALRHAPRGFGVLVPRSERIRSLGTLLSEQIFPGQAPAGMRLLRTMIGGAHDRAITELSPDDLEATVTRDLDQLFGVQAPPSFRRIYRHPRGIAQYTLGHLGRVASTERLEAELPGLVFTGASYRGVSVNGCVKDAHRVCRRLWEVLHG